MQTKIFLAIIFLIPIANATIIDYNVTTPVLYDETLSARGYINPATTDTLCSFFIVDQNNNFIRRLSDESTNPLGYFSTSYYKVTEPTLQRESDYNLTATCGADTATAKFTVTQRRTISTPAAQEFKAVIQKQNLDTIWIIGSAIGLALIIILGLIFSLKKGVDMFGRR